MDLDSTQIGAVVTEPELKAPRAKAKAIAGAQNRAIENEKGGVRCLRCGSPTTIALDKMVDDANTCYLCRGCGHIFSPPTSLEVVQR